MQISDAQSGHDLRLCSRLDRRPRRNRTGTPIEGGRVRKDIPRKDHWHHGRRPQLAKQMKALASGDVVITPAIDRLSRYDRPSGYRPRHAARRGRYPFAGRAIPRHHVRLCRDHLCDPWRTAKLERRRILERTARGRADAKANGVKFGRMPILTPHQQKEARKRLDAGETQRSVARSYNVSQSTISRLAP